MPSAVATTLSVTYGTWAVGDATPPKQLDNIAAVISGNHLRIPWSAIELARDHFNWTFFDSQVETCRSRSLLVSFMIWVGQNSPTWIYCPGVTKTAPDCVPQVYLTDSGWPVFPYYFDDFYISRYYNLLSKITAHLASHPEWDGSVVMWQSAEGSSGDDSPYKAPTKNAAYAISNDQWTSFKRNVWANMSRQLQALSTPRVKLMVNQGNNGENFDWGLANLPCVWLKAGQLSHTYSSFGEKSYLNRLAPLDSLPTDCGRVRGEFEGSYSDAVWDSAPLSNTFTMVVNALAQGLDILNIHGGNDLNQNTPDLSGYAFFNKYAGVRTASASNKAFIYLRDVPDFNDTSRFPESTYGTVINPATLTAYNGQVQRILSDSTLGAAFKATKLVLAIVQNLNPARVTNIVNQFTPAGAKYAGLNFNLFQVYNMDFGVDMIVNYPLFINQLNPHTTSVGRWRIDSSKASNTKYGRYARAFDHVNGKTRMTFDVDDTLFSSTRLVPQVAVSITYYDAGTSRWKFMYANSPNGLGSFTNGGFSVTNNNTNKWVTLTKTITAVNLSNKLSGGDFALQYVRGNDTAFCVIEFEILASGSQSAADVVNEQRGTALSAGAIIAICAGVIVLVALVTVLVVLTVRRRHGTTKRNSRYEMM